MNIMKLRPIFLILSLSLVFISCFSIIKWRFQPSIDFVGGTVWEITFDNKQTQANIGSVFTTKQISLNSITSSDQKNFLMKLKAITSIEKSELESGLKNLDQSYRQIRFETLGPSLGKELIWKTFIAIILSSIALFIFIGRRFKDLSFGISAILAMFHDTLILIGSFSLLGHLFGAELDSLFVTAVLTTLSSSVHDTVVTFDRIRELKLRSPYNNWVELANRAVTETLTRSINNSMTIILMLTSLVLLGGPATRWFGVALLVGVILGTYSSTGVAIPLVLWLKKKENKVK